MKRFVAGVTSAAVLLFAASAWAQGDRASEAGDARREFAEGREAFDAKHYEEAAIHFETAAALEPHAIAAYSAGMAWEKAGKPARAADAFARALALGGLDPDKAVKAQDRLASLEQRLGTLTLTIPDGARAKLDDGPETIGTRPRLHATSGAHVVTVRFVSGPAARRDVKLEAGKVTSLQIAAPLAPDEASEAKPEEGPPTEAAANASSKPSTPTRKIVGFALLGASGAALAASGIFAAVGLGKTSEYNENPSLERYESAKSLETTTNVALVTGILFGVAGAALVLWPAPEKRDVDAEPAAGRSSPSRMSLSVGPASLVVGGAF